MQGCRLITNMRKSISVPESDDSYRLSSAVPHASVSEFEHCVALPRPEPFLSETTSTIDDPLSAQ
jgi:hypothetical protein